MRKDTNRLTGHELKFEGVRIAQWPPERGATIGHAKCSCGTLSPELASRTQRKAWHRAHKDEIRESQ